MFEREELIRFAHCDPAGIVFYPQYFVLLNGLVEDWFTDGLGVDSAELVTVRKMGTPTARMDCTFSRPSRLGDRLVLGLTVTKIGNSAIDLEVQGRVGDEIRLKARQTLVMCCLETMKSVPIPPEIRAGLARYCRDGCSSEGKG
uniref:Acyl-CoA thioesterase n=2 Tax=Aromatoleum buckelii TaxID=200254 RepID=A0ABX1N5D6_9RHOO